MFLNERVQKTRTNIMPHKRNRKTNGHFFYCPHCYSQLWRVGKYKYYLFHQGKIEIQNGLNLTHKQASFLASQNPIIVNNKFWIEEFFCKKDGKIWMCLQRYSCGKISARLATREDWKRTSQTPDPELPNSTVSEFTHRMSRQSNPNLIRKYIY